MLLAFLTFYQKKGKSKVTAAINQNLMQIGHEKVSNPQTLNEI
jgi:hypothetical protein